MHSLEKKGHRRGSTILEVHPSVLLAGFSTDEVGRTVVVFERASSTNDVALRICKGGGYGDGWMILADVQVRGRGRMGREWFSSRGKGLTFSLILRKRERAEELTMLMAVSIVEALEETGIGDIFIKWPNDIFLGGRKLCGILAEAGGDFIVIGAGLNVNEDKEDFPHSIEAVATSLKMETGRIYDRGLVLTRVVRCFERNLKEWDREGLGVFRDRLLSKLLYLNEKVVVTGVTGELEGRFVGITDRGRLVLRIDGEDIEIQSGDVTLKGRR